MAVSATFAIEANALLEAGDLDGAIALCRAGIDEFPAFSTGYIMLARAEMARGNFNEASRLIDIGMTISPRNQGMMRLQEEISKAYTITEHEIMLPEEASIEEASIEEASIEEASIEEASIEEASIEEASIEEASIEEASIEEASIEEASIEEASIEEASIEEASIEEASIEEASIEEASIQEASIQEATTEEATTEEVATEEVATEEVAIEEVATEEVAIEEVATEEVAIEEVATEEEKIPEEIVQYVRNSLLHEHLRAFVAKQKQSMPSTVSPSHQHTEPSEIRHMLQQLLPMMLSGSYMPTVIASPTIAYTSSVTNVTAQESVTLSSPDEISMPKITMPPMKSSLVSDIEPFDVSAFEELLRNFVGGHLHTDVVIPSGIIYTSLHSETLHGFVRQSMAGSIPHGLPDKWRAHVSVVSSTNNNDRASDTHHSIDTQEAEPTMKNFMHIFDEHDALESPTLRTESQTLGSIPGLEFLPALGDDTMLPPQRDVLLMEDLGTLPDLSMLQHERLGIHSDDHTPHANTSDIDDLAERIRSLSVGRSVLPDIDDPSSADDTSDGTNSTPIVSETMAKIYEQQGAVVQAITAYTQLVEQYPHRADEFREKIYHLQTRL